ncbi:MAG: SDR family NAD(P)-dependent oxidoreductase, partial [Rhodospirillaceae bacterium]|nr:SDR family NAD(P)-dependent oxidoreductase [Rhodospirillaceae bacterium]
MPTSSTNALFDLGGKTALVTGAGGHLGAAIATVLSEGGAKVLLNGRNTETLETVREQIITNGGAAELAQFDITSEAQVKAFVADRAGKPLHVLVNNAYAGTAGDIKTTSADDFATALDVGLTAAFRLVQALQPNLAAAAKSDGDASVINIASMYGSVSPDPR